MAETKVVTSDRNPKGAGRSGHNFIPYLKALQFYIYDIRSRQRRDIGRIGSVNAQVLFMDSRHRIWTSSDYGRLIRYDPERDRLETSPYILVML